MAFAADYVVNGETFSSTQLIGAFAVLLGFVLANLPDGGDVESGAEEIPAENVDNNNNLHQMRSLSSISDKSVPYLAIC
jgi:hypothetical protein